MIVKVKTTIEIPYYIEWSNIIGVKISKNIHINVKLEIKDKNSNIIIENGCIKNDRFGRYNTTIVTCQFDCNFEGNLYIIKDKQDYYYKCSKEAINKILYIYKHSYGVYHIKPIKDIDILEYNIKFFDEDNKEKDFFMMNFGGGKVTFKEVLTPTRQILNMLKEDIQFPLWTEYLYNSKDDLELENYIQSIVNINIALENFTYSHFEERMKGILTYEQIKNYVLMRPPSIYKLVKVMYGNVPIANYTLTKVLDIVSKIRKYRNEIVHGKFVNVIKEDAECAILNFEKLVRLSKK